MPEAQILVCFAQYDHALQRYTRYKVDEKRKCTERPQNDLEHLNVGMCESTLYTLNNYPWDPNFGRFHSTMNHFEIQGCWKLQKYQMTLNIKY